MSRRSRLRWWIAHQLNRLPGQCWSRLVDWALYEYRDDPDWRRLLNPWSPITDGCRKDAEAAGRCYCGTLGSDGTQLRRGEFVCVARMPGREMDRLCSRPDGHDGMHRCGGVEWSSISEPVWPQDHATDVTWHTSDPWEAPGG